MAVRRALGSLLVVGLLLTACGGAAGPSPSASASAGATAKPLVKIKASYGNVTPANLAPFMAKDLGLFEKYGLDVDLTLIEGGSPSAAALIANQVDIASFGGTETMSGVAGGADIVAIALFVPVTPWQLLAPTSYSGPNDLKGKTIGVATRGGSAEVAAIESLRRLGLDPSKDVTIQALGNVTNLTTGMLGGAVYAGPGHPPDTVRLLAAGFKVILDLAKEKVPATDNCTVVTRAYLNAHRNLVQRYIDAQIEAIAVAKKDKPTTLKVLGKLLKLDDQTALSQTYDFYVTQIMPAYPHPTAEAFNSTKQALVATNPKVKDLDVTKALDDSFVADAEKRGVGK